jgi:hypothetical protein
MPVPTGDESEPAREGAPPNPADLPHAGPVPEPRVVSEAEPPAVPQAEPATVAQAAPARAEPAGTARAEPAGTARAEPAGTARAEPAARPDVLPWPAAVPQPASRTWAAAGPQAATGPQAMPGAQPREPGPSGPGGAVGRPGSRRRLAVTLVVAVAAVICLVAGVIAGSRAYTEVTRKPTQAELSAASAEGVASRWERVPAGQIFPVSLGYETDLLTQETAQRIGIAPGHGCAPALDAAIAALAGRYGCRAGLRATYLDQLGGVTYTLGVLAFPDPRDALRFYVHYPAGHFPVSGLQALALPGTAAAAFTDAARQAATAAQFGPYIVLSVSGYADGRPAAATDERRASVFSPATQLVSEVGTPLDRPVTVNCTAREWSC